MAYNDPPWIPMDNPRDIRTIGKMLEEVNELGAAAARCLIQGIDGIEPITKKVNKRWLEDEIADMFATAKLTCERFGLDMEYIKQRNQRKVVQLDTWQRGV